MSSDNPGNRSGSPPPTIPHQALHDGLYLPDQLRLGSRNVFQLGLYVLVGQSNLCQINGCLEEWSMSVLPHGAHGRSNLVNSLTGDFNFIRTGAYRLRRRRYSSRFRVAGLGILLFNLNARILSAFDFQILVFGPEPALLPPCVRGSSCSTAGQ